MHLNYDSIYKPYAGHTLSWLPMDTEYLYQHNLANRYNELNIYGWVDADITYQFNSLGFRCKEFNSTPSIMVLGCSFTIGIGLPIHSIWPEQVATELNLQCANLGIGAGSPDTAFRLCHGYIDLIKPKIVIYLEPPEGRIEFIDEKPYNIMSGSYDIPKLGSFYKHWIVDENNNFFNQRKNELGIQMLCEQRNIKYIGLKSSELYERKSLARDLVHPGITDHSELSLKILSMI